MYTFWGEGGHEKKYSVKMLKMLNHPLAELSINIFIPSTYS